MPPSWPGTTSYAARDEQRERQVAVRRPSCRTARPRRARGRRGSTGGPRSPRRTRRSLLRRSSIQLRRAELRCPALELSHRPPPYDARRPRVAGAGREQQHELAVGELARARRAVEREQRVDAAHVAGVVEVGGARLVDAELGRGARRASSASCGCPQRNADVGERRARALERALGRGDEVRRGSTSSSRSFIAAGSATSRKR